MTKWIDDYDLANIVGDDWLEVDFSHSGFNLQDDWSGTAKEALVDTANIWLLGQGMTVLDVRDVDDCLEWLVDG
jgi:hypothetical protein